MLGLPYGKVFLVPWTEEWEIEFMKEKQIIEEQIGEHILAIHHIGSTSIPYLSAKPIIDIAIELENYTDGIHCIKKLELLNYKYRKEVLPERYYFNKGEPRTHQIHMYEKGNSYLMISLLFTSLTIVSHHHNYFLHLKRICKNIQYSDCIDHFVLINYNMDVT